MLIETPLNHVQVSSISGFQVFQPIEFKASMSVEHLNHFIHFGNTDFMIILNDSSPVHSFDDFENENDNGEQSDEDYEEFEESNYDEYEEGSYDEFDEDNYDSRFEEGNYEGRFEDGFDDYYNEDDEDDDYL